MHRLALRPSSLLVGVVLVLIAHPGIRAQEFDGTCTFRGSESELADRRSPLDSATVDLGGETAKICYGRPSARDREIFGGLVPHGELWRLGANEATRLDLPFSAEMGSLELEPGRYSLYVVPAPDQWEFFVSRSTSHWGRSITDEVRAMEVGSFSVPVQSTDDEVETFTISFERESPERARILFEWVDTRVVVPLRRMGS